MASLPGFIKIKDASSAGDRASFIGIVTELKPPYKSRGDDFLLHFTVQDEFGTGEAMERLSTINCKIFRKQMGDLPKLGAVGDVVIVRQIRIVKFGGYGNSTKFEAIASSNVYRFDVLFFNPKDIPNPEFSTAYGEGGLSNLRWVGSANAPMPSRSEQMEVIRMKAAAGTSVSPLTHPQNTITHKPSPQARLRRGFSLIKDVQIMRYYDLVGEVVKTWDTGYNTIDVYLTDYTVNKDLFLYEDPQQVDDPYSIPNKNWQGPYGQITMAIRLWDPHATYVNENIQVGDLVRIDDVHIKMSPANKLEGALHVDQRYPDKVKIRKVSYQAQTAAFMKRKEEYLNSHGKRHTEISTDRDPQLSKTAKKKAKAAKERRLKKQEEQKLLQERFTEVTSGEGCNPHIRASYSSIQFSTLGEIMSNTGLVTKGPSEAEITLPFVNCKYRTRLRVVDFYPRTLEDFTHSMADCDWNVAMNDPDNQNRRRDDAWKWAFVLLVEDAVVSSNQEVQRLPLFVTDKDAQCLLKMDATDLRRDTNEHIVEKLREKLFILWGNLLELKKDHQSQGIQFPLPHGDNRLQNMPFEACIEEYGVKVLKSSQWPLGWQRTHRLLQTVIQD
ncbi:hypothetical protein BU24DRAFT_426448 [Aaosphaeria arxii CBS 175.79]|uniref:Protection of telomeres protein 1 n=1 Tax=Aaosphaeria arxii CBS 175.79 TaxID=1450172 RepID=A0A6A5XEN7_9PLEO|nr:uncharacterized protein BU24DRAFT_426448 [Aaosphaeria arxii CBS 175.79]KAF2011373.1 hypothetical protein BU24DRAFT_426448 [Aaosphaeria arxii CBS 175.79]